MLHVMVRELPPARGEAVATTECSSANIAAAHFPVSRFVSQHICVISGTGKMKYKI